VNIALFKPGDKEDARHALGLVDGKIILFVGRIEALKGIDNLIRSVGILRERDGVKLVVIGGDEHSQPGGNRLKAMTQDLNIADSVQFLGTVPQSRLPLYYNAADVSVVASYYESFCLVILESLACGTPVVSTPVGVAPEVIRTGESGCIAADNSPQNLAGALSRVLGSENMDRCIIRQSITDYDWSAIARRIEGEYYSLVAATDTAGKASV
jgi:D-inositol-3-phosphate glycosyltransferase